MGMRALYLLKTYLVTVMLFIVAKPVFMWYNSANHPFTASDIAQVISHGLSLDLSMALYLLAIPFLCVVTSIFTGSTRWLRIILKIYYAIIAVALILALIADTSLYEFWLFKLESSCLQYLETPTEAMASVSTGYLLIRLVVWIVLALILWLAYTRPEWHIKPSRHRILESLVALLCIPLMVIGIRGGLSESTTNIGQVYFSQNQFLNHSAVNPVFSFFASVEQAANDDMVYEYMDDETCDSIISRLYNTESYLVLQVDRVGANVASAVSLQLGNHSLLNSTWEHVTVVVVGVLTDEVDTAWRGINISGGAVEVLDEAAPYIFDC